MKWDDVLVGYVNGPPRERTPGRYWASEVYGIMKGYITPENFHERGEIDIVGARRIISGIAFEEQLHKIFKEKNVNYVEGEKKVLEIGEIELVVKPDFLFPSIKVVETKFPERPTNEIPEKWKHQLECEYRAFELPTYLGIFSHPFNVQYIEYKPSVRRWNSIQEKLIEFNKQVWPKK